MGPGGPRDNEVPADRTDRMAESPGRRHRPRGHRL